MMICKKCEQEKNRSFEDEDLCQSCFTELKRLNFDGLTDPLRWDVSHLIVLTPFAQGFTDWFTLHMNMNPFSKDSPDRKLYREGMDLAKRMQL